MTEDWSATRGHQVRLSVEERREQIIRAARTVFARSGLAGARTRELAAEAGVNEGVIYRHFASKEELFEAAVAQPLEEAVHTLVEFAGTAPEQFSSSAGLQRIQTRQFVYDLLGVMDEIAPLLGIILFGDAEVAGNYFVHRIQPTLDKIKSVIDINYDAWPHRDFDTELVVELLFGMTWFMSAADRLAGRERNRDVLADQITDIFLDGLRAH